MSRVLFDFLLESPLFTKVDDLYEGLSNSDRGLCR